MLSSSNPFAKQTKMQKLPPGLSSKVPLESGSDTEGRQEQARPKSCSTPSSASLSSLGSMFSPKSRPKSGSFLAIPFSRSNWNLSANSLELQSQHQKLTQDSNSLLWDIIRQKRECAAARRELENTRTERESLEEQLDKLIPRLEKIRALEIEQNRALVEEETVMTSIDEKDNCLRSKMKKLLSEMDDNLPYKREILRKEKKEAKRWQKEDEKELKEEQKEDLKTRRIEQQQRSAEDVNSHPVEKKRCEHVGQDEDEMIGKVNADIHGKRVDATDKRKEVVSTPRSGKTANRRVRKETAEFQRGLFQQKYPGASHSYIVYQ
jgi:hypothetical protein